MSSSKESLPSMEYKRNDIISKQSAEENKTGKAQKSEDQTNLFYTNLKREFYNQMESLEVTVGSDTSYSSLNSKACFPIRM